MKPQRIIVSDDEMRKSMSIVRPFYTKDFTALFGKADPRSTIAARCVREGRPIILARKQRSAPESRLKIKPTLPGADGFFVRLKQARQRMGMTQQELAKKAGIPGGGYAISHYETGRREPLIGVLRSLCIALKTSADLLLDVPK